MRISDWSSDVCSSDLDRVGANFHGRVNGVTRFGLFVTLDDSGADGLIPISTLPDDFYHHVESRHSLEGQRWGRVYRLGDRSEARRVGKACVSTGRSRWSPDL